MTAATAHGPEVLYLSLVRAESAERAEASELVMTFYIVSELTPMGGGGSPGLMCSDVSESLK